MFSQGFTCDVVDGEDPGDDILDMVLEEFSLSRAMEIMGKFMIVKGNFRGVSESHNSRKKKSHLEHAVFQ